MEEGAHERRSHPTIAAMSATMMVTTRAARLFGGPDGAAGAGGGC
jgi:hypothetical protein